MYIMIGAGALVSASIVYTECIPGFEESLDSTFEMEKMCLFLYGCNQPRALSYTVMST